VSGPAETAVSVPPLSLPDCLSLPFCSAVNDILPPPDQDDLPSSRSLDITNLNSISAPLVLSCFVM
jgi:hypothetical protein